MKLNELKKGQRALIKSINTESKNARRLIELGFSKGAKVESVIRGITKGLSAYRIKNTLIALRDETASIISVVLFTEDLHG